MTSARVVLVRSNETVVQDPVPGAVAIDRSVGRGGVNGLDDTQAVQIALNAVPDPLGGAGESLVVDGKVGPLTIGAIETFQKRWLTILDGRCDPTGPTLGLLNAMAGVGDALPSGAATVAAGTGTVFRRAPSRPTPAQTAAIQAAELRQLVVDRHHMPALFQMLLTALRVNDAAERHVQRLKGLASGASLPTAALTDPDRLSFLLVAKTFKLHESKARLAEAGVKRVDSILRQSMLLVNSRLPLRAPLVSAAPIVNGPLFVSLFGRPAYVPPADGYTTLGGLHLVRGPSGFFNPFVIPGRVVPERNERIYLPPLFDASNPDNQRLILLHELAHFVGPASPASGVEDIATVFQTAKWKRLNSFQRLHTADSYAFFPSECAIGTARAVTNLGSTLDAIGEFPKVTSAFFGTEPVITLPPPGDPKAAQFTFPGGFA